MKTQFTVSVPALKISEVVSGQFAKDCWPEEKVVIGENRKIMNIRLELTSKEKSGSIEVKIGSRLLYIYSDKENFKEALEVIDYNHSDYEFRYDGAIVGSKKEILTEVVLKVEIYV